VSGTSRQNMVVGYAMPIVLEAQSKHKFGSNISVDGLVRSKWEQQWFDPTASEE
jgi:hypothetical protein